MRDDELANVEYHIARLLGQAVSGCSDCLDWALEFYVGPDGVPWAREWHSASCPVWRVAP